MRLKRTKTHQLFSQNYGLKWFFYSDWKQFQVFKIKKKKRLKRDKFFCLPRCFSKTETTIISLPHFFKYLSFYEQVYFDIFGKKLVYQKWWEWYLTGTCYKESVFVSVLLSLLVACFVLVTFFLITSERSSWRLNFSSSIFTRIFIIVKNHKLKDSQHAFLIYSEKFLTFLNV